MWSCSVRAQFELTTQLENTVNDDDNPGNRRIALRQVRLANLYTSYLRLCMCVCVSAFNPHINNAICARMLVVLNVAWKFTNTKNTTNQAHYI